jgi:hypothetical protein
MNDTLRMLLQVVVGTGATAVLVRYVVKQAVQHLLDTEKLKFTEELKRVSKLQETALELWSNRQLELFKHLIEEKALVIQSLVRNASLLRRAIRGIGEVRKLDRVDTVYRDYREAFYADPILPKKLYYAAHLFREVAEKMIGACAIAGPNEQLDEGLVRDLDSAYVALLEEARSVLLPTPEERGRAQSVDCEPPDELPPVRGYPPISASNR